MTYNVFSGTLNPAQSTTGTYTGVYLDTIHVLHLVAVGLQ